MTPNKYSELFRNLADKIERNDEKDFGGAFLILPPVGNEISGVIIGQSDIASFFGMVKTKLDVAVSEADDAHKKQQAFGRR